MNAWISKKTVAGFVSLTLVSSLLILTYVHSARADNNPVSQYVASHPLEFAGKTCEPEGNINTTYTYPDGVHPVAHPADPALVANYTSGQQQIAAAVQNMQTAEAAIVKNHANNVDPYQTTLNNYIDQYNALLNKYDICSSS